MLWIAHGHLKSLSDGAGLFNSFRAEKVEKARRKFLRSFRDSLSLFLISLLSISFKKCVYQIVFKTQHLLMQYHFQYKLISGFLLAITMIICLSHLSIAIVFLLFIIYFYTSFININRLRNLELPRYFKI